MYIDIKWSSKVPIQDNKSRRHQFKTCYKKKVIRFTLHLMVYANQKLFSLDFGFTLVNQNKGHMLTKQ